MDVAVDVITFDVIPVRQDDELHTTQPAGRVTHSTAAGSFPQAGRLKHSQMAPEKAVHHSTGGQRRVPGWNEDVLEVYHRPHDGDRPVICLDETVKQLVAETQVPIPAKPGQPERYNYEFQRNGTANLFMVLAPLEGPDASTTLIQPGLKFRR
jgi:hypothetical protein